MTVEEGKKWAHDMVDQAFESLEDQGIPFVHLEQPVERDYAEEILTDSTAMLWKHTGERVLTVRWMKDAGSHFKTVTHQL